jgi:hypothetical protein
MNRDEHIAILKQQRDEALSELERLAAGDRVIHEGVGGSRVDVTEQRKDVLAEKINALSAQIERLARVRR